MQDYSNFPPIKLLKLTLTTCPQASYAYIQLWHLAAKNHTVAVRKSNIKSILFLSQTKLRNSLASLSQLDLLSFTENEEFFVVEINAYKKA